MGEFFEWLYAAFSGWRYLFSSSYRQKKNQEWKSEKVLYVIWDVICGLAGVAFSIMIIYVVVSHL